jgi:hypothetical protein
MPLFSIQRCACAARGSTQRESAKRVAQHQVRLARDAAAPGMQDTLVGLEDALSDQIAGSKTPQRTTRLMPKSPARPSMSGAVTTPCGRLNMEQRPTITEGIRIPKSADDDASRRRRCCGTGTD